MNPSMILGTPGARSYPAVGFSIPSRSPNVVRVIIQDRTDLPEAERPRVRITEIALDKVIELTQSFVLKLKRWFKRLVRRRGSQAAMIGVLLLAKQMGGFDSLHHPSMPLFTGAITSAIASSFKTEIGVGTHNFTSSTGDVVKTALFTSSATLGASTTSYATTNEITGTGYTAGGVTTAVITPTLSGTTAIYDLADASWTSSSFTANGSHTYNSSKSNKSWFIIAFGSDQTVTSGTFTIQWPTADASNAIMRF